MLDIFKTHTMIAAIEQVNPTHTFLRDRYFPTNDATDIFATDDVLVEYKSGDKKLAPYVSPRKGGVTMKRSGYKVERFTPPHIEPKRPLTIDDLKKRGFGEALYSKLTPAQRQGAIMMSDFEEMDLAISRREEAMAAETLLTNACVMDHITDDPSKPEQLEISFYDGGSNPAQYTPDTDWNASGADIIGDIGAVCGDLASRGLAATDVIVSSTVADAILNDPVILKLLDIRNVDIGGIKPEELPNGVTKIARLNCKGHMVDILQYSETYTDDNGQNVPYIPNGKAIVTAAGCGRTLYGAVTQLEQEDGEFHTYEGKRVPKYTADATSNTRELHLTSCPLCIPNNKNAWIVINAIN